MGAELAHHSLGDVGLVGGRHHSLFVGVATPVAHLRVDGRDVAALHPVAQRHDRHVVRHRGTAVCEGTQGGWQWNGVAD